MKYNISITVSNDVCKKAINVSEMLAKHGGRFTLGMEENFPHITIAHFSCVDDDVLKNIKSDCSHAFSRFVGFDVKSDYYRNTRGWIDVVFLIDENLQKIYDISRDILQKRSCEKTSDNWEVNMPHITLSRIDEDVHYDVAQLPDNDYSFVAEEINISLLGKNGTNKKILHRIEL